MRPTAHVAPVSTFLSGEQVLALLGPRCTVCWNTVADFWQRVAAWCASEAVELEPSATILSVENEELQILLWTSNRTLPAGHKLGLAHAVSTRKAVANPSPDTVTSPPPSTSPDRPDNQTGPPPAPTAVRTHHPQQMRMLHVAAAWQAGAVSDRSAGPAEPYRFPAGHDTVRCFPVEGDPFAEVWFGEQAWGQVAITDIDHAHVGDARVGRARFVVSLWQVCGVANSASEYR
jgi:hypothetical protein